MSDDDFHKVTDAFPLFLDIGSATDNTMCVFDPHHSIVITDASGKETVILVCFMCDHFQVGDENEIRVTPLIWQHTLRQFFASEGMANQPDKYFYDEVHREISPAHPPTKAL